MTAKPTANTRTIGSHFTRAGKYAVLSFQAALTIFPIIWVLSNSFRTTDQILTSIRLVPEQFALDNYLNVWRMTSIPRALVNSLTIDIVSILLLLAVVLPLSFVIARFRFRAATVIYLFFSLAVLVPMVTVLPMTFKLFSELGLLGHKYAIAFIYVAEQLPLSVFLMVMFMRTIPSELDEAAIMDGCSILDLFRHVIIPLSRNGIVTIVILSFVAIWNDYLTALVVLSRQADKTLSVVLGYARNEYAVDYGMMSAAIIFAIAPMILIYILVKNRLIKGMAMGAVKG
ncbi:MAG: carbohydrate ABC transporter permease [Anaerolineae bacterium]|jgi:raffinose/stachyose/melibiose transport system permease protein|nr:carbohydrate ABC transporter permease [Anaerolineae bacterium]